MTAPLRDLTAIVLDTLVLLSLIPKMSAPPKKMGLSLYANLLTPSKQQQEDTAGATTISGAPVRYDTKKAGAADDAEQKRKDGTVT